MASDLDFRAQLLDALDSLEQLAAQLLLCGFGQLGDLRDRKFECLGHTDKLPYSDKQLQTLPTAHLTWACESIYSVN